MCKICLNKGCDQVDLCCDTGLYLTDPVRQCSTLIICLIGRGVVGRNGRQWPICSVHTPLLYHTLWLITQHGLATSGIFITSKILPSGVCYCVLCDSTLCTCTAFQICPRTIKVVAGETLEVWFQGNIITKESYFGAFSRIMLRCPDVGDLLPPTEGQIHTLYHTNTTYLNDWVILLLFAPLLFCRDPFIEISLNPPTATQPLSHAWMHTHIHMYTRAHKTLLHSTLFISSCVEMFSLEVSDADLV